VNLLNPHLPPNTVQAKKLQALVFDWAGTTVDFGSLAPARTLREVFARLGVHLTDAEIRRDMGLPKKEHIRAILSMSRVREAWQARYSRPVAAADVDDLYNRFLPLQLFCLPDFSSLIPSVAENVRHFRARGLKIGSTTGYTRAMLDVLLEIGAQSGYSPDFSFAPEDVGSGRPHPFMLYECAVKLRVFPLSAIAKIGDTPADIEEGLNAGAWSIGVAGTGNGIGLSYAHFQALPAQDRAARLVQSRAELQRAGAHYVIDTLSDLDSVLDDINSRLASSVPAS
jgi:phosphonoacetaldehyde hydrolase